MHGTAQKEKTEDYSRGFIEVRETVFALQFAPVSCRITVRQYCGQKSGKTTEEGRYGKKGWTVWQPV